MFENLPNDKGFCEDWKIKFSLYQNGIDLDFIEQLEHVKEEEKKIFDF